MIFTKLKDENDREIVEVTSMDYFQKIDGRLLVQIEQPIKNSENKIRMHIRKFDQLVNGRILIKILFDSVVTHRARFIYFQLNDELRVVNYQKLKHYYDRLSAIENLAKSI